MTLRPTPVHKTVCALRTVGHACCPRHAAVRNSPASRATSASLMVPHAAIPSAVKKAPCRQAILPSLRNAMKLSVYSPVQPFTTALHSPLVVQMSANEKAPCRQATSLQASPWAQAMAVVSYQIPSFASSTLGCLLPRMQPVAVGPAACQWVQIMAAIASKRVTLIGGDIHVWHWCK